MKHTEFDVILAVSGAGMAASSYRTLGLEAYARESMPLRDLEHARERAVAAYDRAVRFVNEFMDDNPAVILTNLGTSLDWALEEIHKADAHRAHMMEVRSRP